LPADGTPYVVGLRQHPPNTTPDGVLESSSHRLDRIANTRDEPDNDQYDIKPFPRILPTTLVQLLDACDEVADVRDLSGIRDEPDGDLADRVPDRRILLEVPEDGAFPELVVDLKDRFPPFLNGSSHAVGPFQNRGLGRTLPTTFHSTFWPLKIHTLTPLRLQGFRVHIPAEVHGRSIHQVKRTGRPTFSRLAESRVDTGADVLYLIPACRDDTANGTNDVLGHPSDSAARNTRGVCQKIELNLRRGRGRRHLHRLAFTDLPRNLFRLGFQIRHPRTHGRSQRVFTFEYATCRKSGRFCLADARHRRPGEHSFRAFGLWSGTRSGNLAFDRFRETACILTRPCRITAFCRKCSSEQRLLS
jgi:hypothetical protein